MLISEPGLRGPWVPDLPAEPTGPSRARLVGVAGTALLAALAAGAAWGASRAEGTAPVPVMLSVEEVAADASAWGTLAAELPHTSCGALVDWAELRSPYAAVARALPCADGSEVRTRITLEGRDGQRLLQVRLGLAATTLRALQPVPSSP